MTTIARPKEGPSAPLFYWAPVIPILMLYAGAVHAQSVELAELEACAALESDDSKLACFEAIVAANRPRPAPAPQPPTEAAPPAEAVAVQSASAEIAPTPEPVQATAATAVAEAAPGSPAAAAPATVDAETARTEPATESTQERSAPAEPPPAPAPATTPATNASAQPAAVAGEPPEMAADEFGREHLERTEDPDQQTLEATVIDVTKTGYGELVFHLDNGQVWRQQEKRYYPYPRDREFGVTISRGILGEYQLQVEGTGRKVTIRRIR